jgi:hypothetical protein
MELILTGKNFSGKEAGEWGVAAQVIDGGKEELLATALKTAETIAGYGRVSVIAGKEVVNKSQELSLREGVEYERRLFHSLFGSKDQKIGEYFFLLGLNRDMLFSKMNISNRLHRHDCIRREEEARLVERVGS